MKKIIQLEIDCGERTCASEPEKFCKYFWYSITKDWICVCRIFGSLVVDDGWALRHPYCRKAESEVKENEW